MEKKLTASDAEAARKEQQLFFDRAALDGLPEVMTYQEMLDHCAGLWRQGHEHE